MIYYRIQAFNFSEYRMEDTLNIFATVLFCVLLSSTYFLATSVGTKKTGPMIFPNAAVMSEYQDFQKVLVFFRFLIHVAGFLSAFSLAYFCTNGFLGNNAFAVGLIAGIVQIIFMSVWLSTDGPRPLF